MNASIPSLEQMGEFLKKLLEFVKNIEFVLFGDTEVWVPPVCHDSPSDELFRLVSDGGFDEFAAGFSDSFCVGEVFRLGKEFEASSCCEVFYGCAVAVKAGVEVDLIPHQHLIPGRKILQHPIVKMSNMGSPTRKRGPIQNDKLRLPFPCKKLIVIKLPGYQRQI